MRKLVERIEEKPWDEKTKKPLAVQGAKSFIAPEAGAGAKKKKLLGSAGARGKKSTEIRKPRNPLRCRGLTFLKESGQDLRERR